MPFIDSLDIANRALQHLGCVQIVSPTEDSKNNLEISAIYDKVRRAELRANVWRFATRRAVLYPLDVNSLLLVPPAWSVSTLYLPGMVVQDSNGLMWISQTVDNIGNTPGQDRENWESYFGSLMVQPWNLTSTTTGTPPVNSYFDGDLVYIVTGPAGYVVYQSLSNANTDTPGIATAWSSPITYFSDQTVLSGGSIWRSLIELNLNNTPADAPAAWSSGTTYSSAQTVTGSDNYVYSSVGSGNVGNNPVTDGGVHWTVQTNSAPAAWSSTASYVPGQRVTGSDAKIYQSYTTNSAIDPTTDGANWALSNNNVVAAWSRTPTMGISSVNWRYLSGATLRNLQLTYPIGAGPQSQSTTRQAYRLPAGFLREAPQDPKGTGSNTWFGPAGEPYNDWTYEGQYIVTREVFPITYRFVADITNVSQMDDMFCEGLACRIAIEACQSLTQSTAKQESIEKLYQVFMGRARTVNGIEIGPVESPVDDYLTVRY